MCRTFKRFDAGRVGVAALQAGDELAAAVAKVSLLVEIGVELLADEAAVALVDGKFVGKGGGEARHQLARRGFKFLSDLLQFLRETERATNLGEFGTKDARSVNRIAHGAEIAGTATAQARAGRESAPNRGRA